MQGLHFLNYRSEHVTCTDYIHLWNNIGHYDKELLGGNLWLVDGRVDTIIIKRNEAQTIPKLTHF
jgi:hypothetical protein